MLILCVCVFGAVMGALYIGLLLKSLLFVRGVAVITALALIGPILIDVFLYASFKSLDFGLVLLLVAVVVQPDHAQDKISGEEHAGGVASPV